MKTGYWAFVFVRCARRVGLAETVVTHSSIVIGKFYGISPERRVPVVEMPPKFDLKTIRCLRCPLLFLSQPAWCLELFQVPELCYGAFVGSQLDDQILI